MISCKRPKHQFFNHHMHFASLEKNPHKCISEHKKMALLLSPWKLHVSKSHDGKTNYVNLLCTKPMSYFEASKSVQYHLLHTNKCSSLYTRSIANVNYYFLSQWYARDYVILTEMKNASNLFPFDAIHATHYSP